MMRFSLALCLLSLVVGNTVAAQEVAPGKAPASLSAVKWNGAGTNYDSLKGKTVVVMTFVTWCPICNGWAPTMVSQVQAAAKDKPVVVLAISTDTTAEQGRQYMAAKGLSGPNVMYGADPNIATSFGFTNKFFNYAIVDPDGNLSKLGNAGMAFNDGAKEYTLAREIKNLKAAGKFRFISEEMSPKLKSMLWPAELGQSTMLQKELKQAEKALDSKDKTLLKSSIDNFLTGELESAKTLSKGSVPEKLTAIEKSSFLSTTFKTSEQGKAAKTIYGELTLDKDLKKEIAAKKAYEQCLNMPASARRTGMLKSAAKRFADTHYGALAEEAANQ